MSLGRIQNSHILYEAIFFYFLTLPSNLKLLLSDSVLLPSKHICWKEFPVYAIAQNNLSTFEKEIIYLANSFPILGIHV